MVTLFKNVNNDDKNIISEIPTCCECEEEFGKQYSIEKTVNKVRHHNHFTGEYIATICDSCNITEGHKTKIIPIYAHNLSGYNSHLFIKELASQMSERTQLKLLPKTRDTFISFDFGCLRFLDSLRQFGTSLDEVAKSLKDDQFKHVRNYINEKFSHLSELKRENLFKLLRYKGIYPYDYPKSYEAFN